MMAPPSVSSRSVQESNVCLLLTSTPSSHVPLGVTSLHSDADTKVKLPLHVTRHHAIKTYWGNGGGSRPDCFTTGEGAAGAH